MHPVVSQSIVRGCADRSRDRMRAGLRQADGARAGPRKMKLLNPEP